MDDNLISIVSDILVGISAIVVAVVALYALSTWRKELIGKTKFEVARNMMSLGLKVKADFQWARNPFTSSSEYATRTRLENEAANVSEVLDEWYARTRRLVPLRENLSKLQEAGWEIEILLSEDKSKPISEAIKIFINGYAELSSAIDSYFDERREEVIKGSASIHQDWLNELRKIIYSTGQDDFSKQIEQATEQLASALRIYVR